jgi:hypothetical protein
MLTSNPSKRFPNRKLIRSGATKRTTSGCMAKVGRQRGCGKNWRLGCWLLRRAIEISAGRSHSKLRRLMYSTAEMEMPDDAIAHDGATRAALMFTNATFTGVSR